MNDRTFDDIVSGLYRAATGAEPWEVALERVRAPFGARFAVLQTIDFTSGRLLGLEVGGTSPNPCALDFLRTYHAIDPRRDRAIALGAAGFGRWHHCNDYIDDDIVASHRFYQDFSLAYDIRYGSHVVFPIRDAIGTAFALELPGERGPLSPDEREAARRLGEHIRDALSAHQRIRALLAQTLAGHALLQTFTYPMWLTDVDRFVVFENPAAERETEAARRVRQRAGHLALASTSADRKLTERLHSLAQAGHGSSTVLKLADAEAQSPAWLHLSLLVPGAILGAFGDGRASWRRCSIRRR